MIGIITRHPSDLLDILQQAPISTIVMKPEEVRGHDLGLCTAIAILGGTDNEPLLFLPQDRVALERQLRSGKRIFSEYCASLGDLYYEAPVATRFERLVYCGGTGVIEGLQPGEILDSQCNSRIRPHEIACAKRRPILQYANVKAHSKVEVGEAIPGGISDRALWLDEPDNLLVCNFRLADCLKTRFAPVEKWQSVIHYIVAWLCGEPIELPTFPSACRFQDFDPLSSLQEQVEAGIARSLSWYEAAGMLVNGGRDGVKEGLGTEVYPGGGQRVIPTIRADCTAETSLAFYMNYLRTGKIEDKDVAQRLIAVCFDHMQYKEEGPLKGMLRWTQEAWGVCYQDDAARVLIPQLLHALYSGTDEYLAECVDALHFLVRTTGTDGTRVQRTDNIHLSPERLAALATEPGHFYSAHYNAYYLGALLLAYRLTGIEVFKQVGIKGLEALMAVYPNTRREYSETQELCRLILPLSWLYWVTGEARHKEWLYQATADLLRFKHPSGGILEWDSGYRSDRNDAQEGEESTLLVQNGDPVVDQLYSMNWLPIGFSQAYLVTKDRYFMEQWEEVARFFISTQIHSSNPMIHGAWARAFDVEKKQVYGLTADVGWGPWAIESGWTVAEIAAGLNMGLLAEQLMKHYE